MESLSKFKDIDLEKIKTFYYVVKLKGVKRASAFLSLSQPSISRRIIELEHTFGFNLLVRHSNGIEITRKGQEVYNMFEATFLSFRALETNGLQNGKRKIRIASTYAMISYIISDIIYDYQQINPQISFDLITEDHFIDILLDNIDIAICPIDERIKNNAFNNYTECDFLISLEKKLFASDQYLKKYGEPKNVNDLKNHRLLAFSDPDKHPYADVNWILNLNDPYYKPNKPYFTSTSIESLVRFAERGEGIISGYSEMSIIKNSSLKQILPDVVCKPIKDYLLYPSYLKDDLEIVNLVNYLKDRIKTI